MWTQAYDRDLEQYYYINEEDQSISYDLPCEVQYTPEAKLNTKPSYFFISKKRLSDTSSHGKAQHCPWTTNKQSLSTSVFSKISSVLSRKNSLGSTSSSQRSPLSAFSLDTLVNERQQSDYPHAPVLSEASSIISGDDDYLIESPMYRRSKNYLSGYASDPSLSEESIHSYYSELVRDEFQYEFEDESIYDLEREKERLELRKQIRLELEAWGKFAVYIKELPFVTPFRGGYEYLMNFTYE